ncbi:YIP1 family protein [Pseudoalteromonas shioyasakiensis]|uniref:YIP1 family protein n=1 Tax=Pseudoalteromonas shioyasakiensis TaxID=1190813 RepID=UPI0021191768|nr:YIP1 family protein [Pseudoalteromonas shioyasakiensis]MCQ8879781.1 YIP1 family protein [Pseudoalteromonas shioyasakiensis]
MKSANALSASIDIFISPSKTFNGLKEAKGWSWLAFALITIMLVASTYIFYSNADSQFILEEQVAAATVDATIGEKKMIRQSMEQGIDNQIWFAMGGGVFGIILINALIAGYYLLVSKQDPDANYSYGAWYGFGFWAMMPMVISSLGVIALVLTASTNELSMSLFNYASINQLILGLELGHPFYTMMESLNIFSIWGIALAAIGLKCWTNFSLNKAILFAALPSIIIYGIWTVIAVV